MVLYKSEVTQECAAVDFKTETRRRGERQRETDGNRKTEKLHTQRLPVSMAGNSGTEKKGLTVDPHTQLTTNKYTNDKFIHELLFFLSGLVLIWHTHQTTNTGQQTHPDKRTKCVFSSLSCSNTQTQCPAGRGSCQQ